MKSRGGFESFAERGGRTPVNGTRLIWKTFTSKTYFLPSFSSPLHIPMKELRGPGQDSFHIAPWASALSGQSDAHSLRRYGPVIPCLSIDSIPEILVLTTVDGQLMLQGIISMAKPVPCIRICGYPGTCLHFVCIPFLYNYHL